MNIPVILRNAPENKMFSFPACDGILPTGTLHPSNIKILQHELCAFLFVQPTAGAELLAGCLASKRIKERPLERSESNISDSHPDSAVELRRQRACRHRISSTGVHYYDLDCDHALILPNLRRCSPLLRNLVMSQLRHAAVQARCYLCTA